MRNIQSKLAPLLGASLAMFSGSVYAADAKAQTEVTERLQAAGTIFSDITKAPDNGIPDELLQKAHCAVVVPSLKKGALIVSAKYGKGFVTCRRPTGWSAPAAIRIEGGGVGFQIGGSETELVLLVMNDRGAQRLMSSQFTIGGEGEIAAGPVGRNATAQTDGKFTAEILSWSRARGVFAGIALQGGTLRQDEEENEALYGKKLTTEQIVNSSMAAPAAAGSLLSQLNAHSPVEKK